MDNQGWDRVGGKPGLSMQGLVGVLRNLVFTLPSPCSKPRIDNAEDSSIMQIVQRQEGDFGVCWPPG